MGEGIHDWTESAVPALRERRLDPFGNDGSYLEKTIFAMIDQRREPLEAVACGKVADTFAGFRNQMFWRTGDPAIHEQLIVLARMAGCSDDQIALFREVAGDGQDDTYMNNLLSYFLENQFDTRELLRHRRLLPEQRAILASLESKVGFGPMPAWFESSGDDSMLVQNVRYAWASAWHATFKARQEGKTLQKDEWMNWYTTTAAILTKPQDYRKVADYTWELAELAHRTPTDPVMRFLGGVLLCSVMYREGARHGPKALIPELERLLPAILEPGNHVMMRERKTAWRVAIDEKPYFVFKQVTTQDARLLETVNEVARDPTASHWRLATSRIDMRDPREVAHVEDVVRDVKGNERHQRELEVWCVKPVGVRLRVDDSHSVIAMEYAGGTLADRIAANRWPPDQELAYMECVEVLQRFHLIMTENAFKVGDSYYLTQHPVSYRTSPVLPEAGYAALVRRRLVGTTERPRLGENRFLGEVMKQVQGIAAYLARGCLGVTVVDTDETNFTDEGLIDLNPRWGNVCWDLARLLYGGSYVLKQGLDREAMQRYYITTMTRTMVETSLVSKEGKGHTFADVEKKLRFYFGIAETRESFIAGLRSSLRSVTPSTLPEYLSDALIAHSAYTAALDWDYCRGEDSREEMVCYTQAAGILVAMGEVGSRWNQLHQCEEGTVDYYGMRNELSSAIGHSLALMYRQDFAEMAGCWRAYLEESGKIPTEFIEESASRDLAGAMVPDLRMQIEMAPQIARQRRDDAVRDLLAYDPDVARSILSEYAMFLPSIVSTLGTIAAASSAKGR